MDSILLFVLFSLTHSLLPSSAQVKGSLPKCPPVLCGNDGLIQFPFNITMNPKCGVLKVKCSEDRPKIQLKEEGHWYRIDSISQPGSLISIVVLDEAGLPEDSRHRCNMISNYSLPSPTDSSHFSSYNYTADNLSTLYNCSHNLCVTTKDSNQAKCGKYDCNPPNISFPYEQQCPNITLPFSLPPPPSPYPYPSLFINLTFRLHMSPDCFGCDVGGGECHNIHKNQFGCILPHKDISSSRRFKAGIAFGGAFGGIGIIVIVVLICRLWKKQNQSYENVDAFLKNYGPIQVRRYSYSNIKKMTNSFTHKIGQGGFGDVYKGKLDDGSLVAVKVLNQTKGEDGQDFINEVATISRTSHVNIVTLMGFCFGPKKALIYEFMPNGSLEKFIFDDNASDENSHHLDWETYYQISLDIAKGLEYLHRGCNTRILHFDIKPHNILLDAGFVPKISDFGLAKICKREESIVSMLGARGTAGYIAPEVFNRSFGSVSHKSDVYSYGMMVLEMIGGRKNINIQVNNTSEIYFPHWIYKRLEIDEDLGLKRIINEENGQKVKKMIIISLWCIQTNPSNRPAMSRVIEMLEGNVNSLEIPPKPFLYSPSRSPPRQSSQKHLYNGRSK